MTMKKFYTTVSRYIDGEFIRADAEHPALCEIDVDKFDPTNDPNLKPADSDEAPAPVEVKPHFSTAQRRNPDRVAKKGNKKDVIGKQPGDERPSDSDPATE